MRLDALAPAGENRCVHIERTRDNVFTVVATGQELSALVGAARMSLDVMQQGAERPPRAAIEQLDGVLRDFDRALARLSGTAPAGS